MADIQITPDTEEYLQAAREYIGPYTGQFNYSGVQYVFLDKSRFYTQTEMLQKLYLIQGAIILSSGCGAGGSLVAYHDFGARLAVGLEVEPIYIRLASIRTRQLNNTYVVHYDGGLLPFPDDTFDIVDSIHVIEHVQQPQLYLDEIVRVLKLGGMCYLEFPNRLYPIEAHTQIPLVVLLPKRLGDRLCKLLSRWSGFNRQQRDSLDVVEWISLRYLTLVDVPRMLRRHPVRINYIGTIHPRFRHLNRFELLKFLMPTKWNRVIFYKLPRTR